MNKLYKYLITASAVLIILPAAAQQPRIKLDTSALQAHMNVTIEKALKTAEESIRSAELKIKSLKLEEKLLATIDKKNIGDIEMNAEREMLKAKEAKLKRRNIDLKEHKHTNDGVQVKPSASTSEKQKQITKSYKVNLKHKLSINNKYGRITVNTWNKPEFKIDILIKAHESTDSKAQELLDGVSIEETNRENVISFKTTIEKKSSSWWGTIKRSSEPDVKRGVEVFYTIYMPPGNPLDITNSYGSVILPDFNGPVNLNNSYSSLTAQNLENSANKLNISYGSASIEALSGTLNISYGSLNLINADRLHANIKYAGSAKINKISNGGNLDIKYTPSLRVNEVDKSVKKLLINSSYSGVTVGFDKSANYNFDVTVSFGGFNYNNKEMTITDRSPDDKRGFNPTKTYKGTYGTGSKDSEIVIKSSYGGVRFL